MKPRCEEVTHNQGHIHGSNSRAQDQESHFHQCKHFPDTHVHPYTHIHIRETLEKMHTWTHSPARSATQTSYHASSHLHFRVLVVGGNHLREVDENQVTLLEHSKPCHNNCYHHAWIIEMRVTLQQKHTHNTQHRATRNLTAATHSLCRPPTSVIIKLNSLKSQWMSPKLASRTINSIAL